MPLKYSRLLIYKRFVIFSPQKKTGKCQKAVKQKIPKQNKTNAHKKPNNNNKKNKNKHFHVSVMLASYLVVMESDLECV